MPKSIAEQIRGRIKRALPGSIFLVRDFLDLGSRSSVDVNLLRLTDEGLIRRLQQGIYEYPRFSTLLGKSAPPDIDKVAEALARRTGNRIAPTQAKSANALRLTTQIQGKNIYLTDANKTKSVKVGNQTIELRPVAARYFPTSKSEAVIQGLRFVGEGNITAAMIEQLRDGLDNRQKAALRRKIPDAPGWMHDALRQVTEKTVQKASTT